MFLCNEPAQNAISDEQTCEVTFLTLRHNHIHIAEYTHGKGIGTREQYSLDGDEISMITLVICSSLVTKPKGVSTFYTS